MIMWPKGSIGTYASIAELNVVISGMSTFQNRWWKAQTFKILWDFTIQMDKKLTHNKSGLELGGGLLAKYQ